MAIADCGACTSIISQRVISMYPHATRHVTVPPGATAVESVDGSPVMFEGTVEMDFTIAGRDFSHRFAVMVLQPC